MAKIPKKEKIKSADNPSLLKIKLKSAKEVSEFAENIIDTVREPLIVLDKDLRVVKASQSFYDFFKVTPGETIGTLIYNLGNNQWDIPKLRELLEKILPEKTTFDNFEVEHFFSTIGKRIMLLNARKIQRGSGKEQIILLAIEDITERKLAEEALTISETRYRSLFESAKDGILILDSGTGRIVDVNPILIQMLGYTKEQFINKTIWEIGIFKDIVTNQDSYLEFQKKGYNRYEHLPLETKDGRRIDIEFVSHVNIAHQQKVTQCNIRDITEHILIEELLRESEEKYRILSELSPEMIYLVDLNGCISYLNKAGGAQFRVNPSEIVGKHLTDVFPPDIADRNLTAIQKVIKTKAPSHTELEMKFPFGNMWVSSRLSPVFDKEYHVVSVLGLSIDISERKHAEDSLRKSEYEFRILAESMPQMVWITRPDGWNIYFNQQWMDYTGQTLEESYGHGWNKPFHPDDQQQAWDAWQNAIKNNAAYSINCRLRRADGVYNWYLIRGVPVLDEHGIILKWFGTCTDINELKLTEEELQESEEKYRELVEGSPDAIVIYTEGKIVFANRSSVKLTRASSVDELIGKPVMEFVHPEYKEFVIKRMTEMIESGEAAPLTEEIFLRLDGSEVDVEVKALPITYKKKPAIQIIAHDITKRKRFQESLKKQKDEFETIFNLVPAQIWYKDNHNNFIRVNRQACTDIGMTNDKIEGHSAEELFPSYAQQYFKDDLEVLNTHKPKLGIIEQVNTSSGEMRWVHTDKIPVFGNEGEVNGLIAVVQDITDLKLSEEALRNSEARLRTLIQTIPDLIWLKDVNGVFLSCNKMFERLLGASEAEIVGKTDYDFVDRELADFFRENDRNAMAAGKPTSNEESLTFANDGHIALHDTIKTPMYDSQGKLIGVLGISRDITERKHAEEKLRESDERFRHSFDYAATGICIVGIDRKFQRINNAFSEIIGYDEDEIKKFTFDDITHPDDRSIGIDQVKKMLNGGIDKTSFEKRYIRKDGQIIWVYVSSSLIRDVNHKPQFFITQIIDITERTRTNERISMLAQSLRSINEIVSITDMEDKIQFVNESYLKTYGYNENELIGQNARLVISPNNPMNLSEEIFSATRSGGWKGEVWDIRKDGSEFPIYLSTSIIFDKDKKPLGLIGVAIDMTEQKRIEVELVNAKDRAESANKLKDAFIANISHEIRTPLNGILGMSSLIRDILPDKIKQEEEELFEGMEYSSQRLIRTVDMILNYSRLQVGEFLFLPKNFELSAICMKLITEYAVAAKNKSLDLTFQNNCGDANLFADEYSIVMAISNIIDNAIKYTDKGFINVILWRGKNDDIILEIKDTGIGISGEHLENIFKPYHQEQMGYGRAYEGIGLGLSLTKQVLDLNKARISVESKKGEGTTFSINFGRAVQSVDKIADTVMRINMPPDLEEPVNGVVLLVEDDEMNQMTINKFIGSKYSIVITDSSDEALKILKKEKVDIILMDISIRGKKNGLELTRELKASKEFSHIPVIAVTAHAFEKDKQNALEAGCDNYLAKPFTKESLLDMIADFTHK